MKGTRSLITFPVSRWQEEKGFEPTSEWPQCSVLVMDPHCLQKLSSRTQAFVVVQSLSHVWLWDFMPGSPVLNYLPEFASVHVHWAGDAISSSAAVFSFCLQSFPATESFPMSWLFKQQVAKVLELQLQHQSFQWIVRLISFRIDWFELLAVQGTLKSLLQHHNLKDILLVCIFIIFVCLSALYCF